MNDKAKERIDEILAVANIPPRRVKVLMFDGPYDGHTFEFSYDELHRNSWRYKFLLPTESPKYERLSFSFFDQPHGVQHPPCRTCEYEFEPLVTRRGECVAFAGRHIGSYK